MIGYFQIVGDSEIGALFSQYFDSYWFGIKKYMEEKKYGTDLNLLLIRYYVSGKNYDWDKIKPKVLNYSNKEKAISVIIGIKKEDFIAMPDQERYKLFVNTTRNAVMDVRSRLEKKKMNIDFDSLLADLEQFNKKFLSSKEFRDELMMERKKLLKV